MSLSSSASQDVREDKKGFSALIATIFEGAFSDNLFEWTMVFFLVAQSTSGVATEQETQRISSFVNVVFAIPFIMFPGIFGALSDRYSKKQVIVWSRWMEIVIMAVGAFAFWKGTSTLLWLTLFAMMTKSAMLSPAKYGILPEILTEGTLARGNGIMQMATMVAIIAGTGLAGPLSGLTTNIPLLAGGCIILVSVIGLLLSFGIARPPAANPSEKIPLNPWKGMGQSFRVIGRDKVLLVVVIGYTYFWFAGAFLRANIIPYGKTTLHLTSLETSAMMGLMAIGIGCGSLLAGYLSRGRINLHLVHLGAAGLVLFAFLLAMPSNGFITALCLMFLLGGSAGFFDVPLAASLQHRSPPEFRGNIIAASNMLTFVGVLAAGGLGSLLPLLHINTRGAFVLSALFSTGIGLFMFVMIPKKDA